MNDWDVNPSKYLTDSEGNFKLKADGTPRKKGGRPKGSKSRGYNYHSQTKAKLAAKKQVRIKEKQIEQTRNKLNALRSSANTSKDVLAKLDVGEEVIRRTLERVGTKYAATSVTGPVAAGLAVYETAVLLADVANASIRAADKDVDFWDNFGNVDDKYSITYKLTKPFYESVFKGISNLSELSNEDNQVESYSMETVGR